MIVKLKPNKAMQDCLAELVQNRTIIHVECEASQMDVLKYNAQKAKNLKAYKRPIICISTGVKYDSIQRAAKDLGLSSSAISRCAKGFQHTTKGYKFKYLIKE